MVVYTLDAEDMTRNANVIKETVLSGLEAQGFLKPGQALEISEKYAVILHKKGWLGSFWDKWFEGIKEGSFRISFVKIVS